MTTTTPVTAIAPHEHAHPPLWRSGAVWVAALVLAAAFVAYHHVFLQRTWMFAMTDRNWSHALLVPAISLFYIHMHRDRLAAARFEPGWWGLPILFVGLFGYAFGIYPVRNDMLQGYSVIVALFGAALWALGPAAMRVLWFPIVYLVFAVKVSDRIWEQVAWQLQQVAAEGATLALQGLTVFFDFDVIKRGATIELVKLGGGGGGVIPLNVAEACSGLRMLMAFIALATAMAFLWPRAWWQRAIMVLMAVPIAVFVNVVRVAVLGLVALIDPTWIEGAMHSYIGLSMILPAAALFWLLGWALDRCVIREASEHEPSRAEGAPGRLRRLACWRWREAQAHAHAGDARPHGTLLGGIVGVGVTLVAGATYAGMVTTAPPRIDVPGMPMIASHAAIQLLWTLTPPALVGSVLAMAALSLLRRRCRARLAGQRVAVGFLVGTLATLAVGHGSVLAATRAVLIKDPLPLRHTLWMVPDEAGPWTLDQEDPPLSNEQLEALGTRTYLSRVYRDTSWPADRPGALARLHVSYYTGRPDTVPHVPERCFVAAGLTGLGQGRDTLTLDSTRWRRNADDDRLGDVDRYVRRAQLEPRVHAPAREIEASRFTFAHPGEPQRAENVFYFFIANGRFLATPDMVRLHGFDPTDRYSYYAKIEIQLLEVADVDAARARAESLMDHLLPEILATLPDWAEVERGDWPTPEAAARAQRSGI